jgi:hypothetical protein
MQVLIAIKYCTKDISNIINNFFIMAGISLELKKGKEHQQLHSELIENTISSCVNAYDCIQQFGIDLTNIEEIKELYLNQY